jgi:hypothetical protein
MPSPLKRPDPVRQGQQSPSTQGVTDDALLAFVPERESPPTRAGTAATLRRMTTITSLPVIAVAIGAVAAVGVGSAKLADVRTTRNAEARPGKLSFTTRPDGAQVLLDGRLQGVTPLTLAVEPGTHSVTLRHDRQERSLALTVAAGAEVAQYIELPASEPRVASRGQVSVVTDPPGALVTIDGRSRGFSPVTVPDLSGEEHKVSVSSDTGAVERVVTVQPGSTTSVVFSLPKTSPSNGGWLALSTPFDLQVFERDELVGVSGAARIMLVAGRHELALVNQTLGYQQTRRIDVAPGKVTALRIDAPKAALNINARPWADVSVDANAVGQTPIANLLLPIGTHQLTFRHPQLGERQQSVVVTTTGPNRIAVDLTK